MRSRLVTGGAAVTAVSALVAVLALTVLLSGCGEMELKRIVRESVTGEAAKGIYVSPDGADWRSGLDPDHPVQTIQTGVQHARLYSAAEVRVAEGTYTINTDQGSIDMQPGVSLMGGYSADFSERDPDNYPSVLESSAILEEGELVSARGGDIQNVSVDGFTFDIKIDTDITEECWISAISLGDGPSVNIRNNTFLMDLQLTGDFPSYTDAIGLWTNEGERDDYDFEIHGNEFCMYASCENNEWGLTAIALGRIGDDSNVEISANTITVINDTGWSKAISTRECGQRAILIYNNAMTVIGDGGASGIQSGDSTTVDIVNNTIIVSDYGQGQLPCINFVNEQNSQILIVNNILGTPDGTYAAVYNDHDGACDYGHNLAFGFDSALSGNVNDTGGNTFEAANIFSTVFQSDFDTDLADGYQADYRLHDPGNVYAVDMGTPAIQDGLDVDIEGASRPQGSAVDRGAYEKVQ